jgi:hypothetical protein
MTIDTFPNKQLCLCPLPLDRRTGSANGMWQQWPLFFFVCLLFWDRVSLCCPGWPVAGDMALNSRSSRLSLPGARITEVYRHAQLGHLFLKPSEWKSRTQKETRMCDLIDGSKWSPRRHPTLTARCVKIPDALSLRALGHFQVCSADVPNMAEQIAHYVLSENPDPQNLWA